MIEAEVPKVVVKPVDQFFARESGDPRFVRTSAGAQFAHNDQASRVGVKSTLDNLIGYVRAVIVACVDVVYAGGDRLAQNANRGIDVLWRTKNLRPGKLHGAVAHAIDAGWGAGKFECAAELRLVRHRIFSICEFVFMGFVVWYGDC
jgi:hypothetical protein